MNYSESLYVTILVSLSKMTGKESRFPFYSCVNLFNLCDA